MLAQTIAIDPAGAVLSGQLLVSIPIALLAGLVSFASPCILPLVPGYLGLVGSLAGDREQGRRRLVTGVALFVAGFTAVFVLGTALVGAASSFLVRYGNVFVQISGVVLIAMGLVFIGQLSFLQRVWRPRQIKSGGMWSAPVVGVIFAVGWTPCSGPTLAAISALTVTTGSASQGAILGLAYALGLGVPFLLIALGLGWAGSVTQWMRRHVRAINAAGGGMLILIGILMVTGIWSLIMNVMQGWVASFVTVI
ncbi:cytochrome c biogenesis protein CcdA [Agrococcus sediminis]|uniref:Cytochrome c biogenesis protein CcdA n=1 Tax=Agrococcus sediminis TaxID=2599924 RepID=A0A5M8QPL9_9MICO|nr:cytochrome c biogenesis protein CcdA [Agrococcus sediminis]KAA6436483.1 cytochrome c biogenesis protein CcdA [Agrococcus sediminis]RWR24847.1 cytochrome c biogenesis protein CcdA [Agrococcus lahaulensis]